jgi:WD40 repeat protein
MVQLGHSLGVESVAFSPDGKYVLTGSYDGTARLWEAETGRELRRFDGHSMGPSDSAVPFGFVVKSVAFSPDGRHVLTVRDNTARMWEAETGMEVRRFEGHAEMVWSAAFSPDGEHVLTGSFDKTTRVWEAETGKEIRRFEADRVRSVAYSPDGKYVLSGYLDKTARLFEAETGKQVRAFDGHAGIIGSVAFSPDGKYVLTGSSDKTARLWEAQTGRAIVRFEGHSDEVASVAFSPDGKYVLTGSSDKTARLWEAQTGRAVVRFEGHSGQVNSVAFSPDGKYVLTGGGLLTEDKAARLWEAQTGREVRRFEGHSDAIASVAFSPDGRYVVTGGSNDTTALWETMTGKEVQRLGHAGVVLSVAFSPDGKYIVTGGDDKTARLWEPETGREVRRFAGDSFAVSSVAVSPDGRFVLTGDITPRLWETKTGAQVLEFKGDYLGVHSVAFSPDGRYVISGGVVAQLWEATTGRELKRLGGDGAEVRSVAFSPDGKYVVTGSDDKTARLWEAETAREVRRFEGHSGPVSSVAFSPDRRYLLTEDGTARLWETATGKEMRRFEFEGVTSVAFSPEGRHVLTGGFDGTARLWDVATGKQLCSLISFSKGGSAVVDPEGRYDAANGGDVAGLHWVLNNQAIDLKQFKERYYDPGLLAKLMGRSQEPLRNVSKLEGIKFYPKVEAAISAAGKSKLEVKLTNQGGGIGRTVVTINGKEMKGDARGPAPNPLQKELKVERDLDQYRSFIKPGEKNKIEVRAYNAEGWLASRGVEVLYDAPGEKTSERPHLWAIIAGISRYSGSQLALTYAAKDAEDMAQAVKIGATGLFGADHVHLTLLTSSAGEPGGLPTRDNLVTAFQQARQAKATDVLLVYLSGHGISYGGQDGDYYYLTSEATSANFDDPGASKQKALSSAEVSAMIQEIPALKQVLILDTCAAGRAAQQLSTRTDVSSSTVRALDRMKDRTGMFILAGAAADKVSYEASRYAQGVLTYSLLEGMRGAALSEGSMVDVSHLFQYASNEVPKLALGIGGIQTPVLVAPKGGASFDIGRVEAQDKARIPFHAIRPVVLRANFQDEERFDDQLNLIRLVDEALRDASARGPQASLVFWDAEDGPDAHRLVGRYRVEGASVTVTARVFKGSEAVADFRVSGRTDNLSKVVSDIVVELDRRIRR